MSNVKKMFDDKTNVRSPEEMEWLLNSISGAYAFIEFTPDGKITNANDNFCQALGYDLDEIVGRHHKTFVDAKEASSFEYKKFWEDLKNGETQTREFKRITKTGQVLWIYASYIPVRDSSGSVVKVVKLAQDINARRLQIADFEGQLAAISKAQAVIEFNLDGTIITANDNFCQTLGYALPEIQGKHHAMFCDATYTSGHEYKAFWDKLRSGEFVAGEFRRVGKGGKDIWINASYNPIFDLAGKPCKVVKFASDITVQKNLAARSQSILDNMQANLMLADLSGKITYMNPKSKTTLKTLERNLPIAVDKIEGSSMDIFHRNPSHQRNMLATDRNLPYKAQIRLADRTLELNVAAMYDFDKKYMGPLVTWDDVTEKARVVTAVEETANSLAGAANELMATATQMSGNATKTSEESTSASAAAEEVASGVQTVATNTEEMAASIKEIARSANESSDMSKKTLEHTQHTNKTVTQLGVSSQEIGNVIKVISSIAQQTNLLALNATIEAARAGDAGKGFAVVANEVKELAKQTAKATEEITVKIGAIQKDSGGAVEAIGSIAQAVEKLNGIAGAIAAAVEEQTATTNEVSRVVQESSKGVEGIAKTIKVVSGAASENANAANQTLEAAKGLSQLAEKLKNLIENFKKA